MLKLQHVEDLDLVPCDTSREFRCYVGTYIVEYLYVVSYVLPELDRYLRICT